MPTKRLDASLIKGSGNSTFEVLLQQLFNDQHVSLDAGLSQGESPRSPDFRTKEVVVCPVCAVSFHEDLHELR